MKARPGWRKVADNVSTSLTAGGGQIIAGGMGLAAMGAGGVEALTGLEVGGREFSAAAADKARENAALTQAHELTGTADDFKSRTLSGLSQALPSTVLSMVTGGGPAAGAILSGLQTAGGQYAETYAHNIDSGMGHDEAFAQSAPAAAFSGLMSGVISRAVPGGVTPLNGGAIRSMLSTGANRGALSGSITDAIRAYASTTVQGAKALASGALKEIPQEVLDQGIGELSAAYAKKGDIQGALVDFYKGLPLLITTSGILGAGGEHISQSHANLQQEQQEQKQGTQPEAASPQQGIPDATTQEESGSGQPLRTTANNRQPSQTDVSPSALPVPTLDQALEARKTADKLKAQEGPLSPEQKQELDVAEKTFARKTEDNIFQHQTAIEKRGGTLHPTAAKALAGAQATLARKAPGGAGSSSQSSHGNTESTPPSQGAASGNSGQQSSTPANNGQPPSTAPSARPSRPPLDPNTSRKLIDNVEKIQAHRPLNPVEQADMDQAKGVVVADAQKVIDNIAKMRPEAQQHPQVQQVQQVQQDLAEAQKVVEDHGPKPEGQTEVPRDAQRKALADEQSTRSQESPESSTQSSSGSLPPGGSASTDGVSRPAQTSSGTPSSRQPIPQDTTQSVPVPAM